MILEGVRRVYGARWPWLFALYFSLATICGYISWSRIVIALDGTVYTNQTSVDTLVSTVSDKPIGTARWALSRSRIFVPYIIVGAKKYLGIPYRVTHDGTRLLFIFLAALLFHWHLRTWFSPLEALAGTTLLFATITITFNHWYPIVTDFPELIGMTTCSALLVRRRWVWMLVALSVATLNRENSIVLVWVALCFLYEGRKSLPRVVLVTGAIAATWWTAFMVARVLAGVGADWIQPPEASMRGQGLVQELVGVFQDIWPRRRDSILSLVYNPHPYNVNWSFFLFLNIFWVLPLAAWRSIPVPLRRLYIGGLLGGFPIFFLVGVLNEAGRHMIPLYPLLYPAGLYVLFRYVTPGEDRAWASPVKLQKDLVQSGR